MAMKEYELAPVSEGHTEDDFFRGASPVNSGSALDAGQRSLLDGDVKMDEEMGLSSGPSGPSADDGRTVWCGLLSVRYYQQFFNVDTKDVVERWSQSVMSFKREKSFLEVIEESPDAYGPFWNATSLVFLIALCTNIRNGGHDISKLVESTWVVYGFVVLAPVLAWLGLNQLDISVKLIQAVCVYGYSLGPFLVATIVCAIPLPYAAVVALTVAGVLSMVFLLRTFTPLVMEKNTALSVPICVALGILQGVFALVLLLSFFA